MEEQQQNIPEIIPQNEIKLNKKQQDFIKRYIESNGRATESYMSVYQVDKRTTAKAAASKLLTNPKIKAELQRSLLQVKSLERIDKSFVVSELKELAAQCKKDKNYKYLIEALDMLNKIAGFYNHNSSPGNITITGQHSKILFSGFDPDSVNENLDDVKSSDNSKILQIEQTNIDEELDDQDFTKEDEVENDDDFQSF